MSEKTAVRDMTKTPEKSSFAHRLYTGKFSFGFISRRRIWYTISAILLVISALSVAFRGLNLGIEFEGGSVFQAPATVTAQTTQEFGEAVTGSGIADLDPQIRTVGENTVRIQTRSLNADEVIQVREAIAQQAGVASEDVAYSLIGPSWGEQITQKALIALVVFLVLVGVLIWFYFRDAKMSIAALSALLHDLLITIGLYALVGFTVSPSTVIAVLTILGYSLYDTVVVFDMVREKTADLSRQDRSYSDAANEALNQVLVRSINTTVIAVLPVVAILVAGVAVLGGEGALADLGLAMLIGMLAGAYSSIFLATPLLAQMREREPAMVAHRQNLAKATRRRKHKPDHKEQAETAATDARARRGELSAGALDFVADDQPELSGEAVTDRIQPQKLSRADRKKLSDG